ncbi:hypothetical protein BFJ66_g11405 [Fusarium oxysporum f. sp. cepae]|uniref:Uncharacterized protein n=1 Tax=Fusarium oxysporum f. sp. cepae TaxID=396571 RepID=A0A3L6NF53_FUSOX|nr:hypothetical protein BFJ65_g10111 [Fusarium oxysporum f. sp. cepae]RKK40602.1 hypothetical protein BFJ66_g11405 [Fusarium oxysporum f. sp. cepae]RKK60505.1 hypothetical protein BFJ67_g2070 [Fusarium oxysporum f. sp. cepae]
MRDRYTVSHGAGKEGLLVVQFILVPNQAQATTAHTL